MTKKVRATQVQFLHALREESERGTALICVAMIDDLLERTILAFLVDTPEKDKLLTGFNAPLGMFSSRVLAAYSLGLISEREYRECNCLGKIRNEFAHNVQQSFDDQKVKDLCATLTFSKHYEQHLADLKQGPARPRGRYMGAAVVLIGNLQDRPRYASERRLKCTEWEYPDDPTFRLHD